MKLKNESIRTGTEELPAWLEIVRESVEEVRFGTVQIVIHEGRVTQVDATRRTRLADGPASSSAR